MHTQTNWHTLRKVVPLVVLVVFSFVSIQGQTALHLTHKKKKYIIKPGEECYISTVPFSNDTAKDCFHVHIGHVLGYKDSVITFNAIGFNTSWQTPDGEQRLERTGLDNVSVNINLRQAEEIENFRNWFIAPALVGWLSLVSGVIVSPLVSTNFRKGEFYPDRLLKVSGISFGTAAISMTIAYGFGRHSAFLNHGKKRHKKLWTIKAP